MVLELTHRRGNRGSIHLDVAATEAMADSMPAGAPTDPFVPIDEDAVESHMAISLDDRVELLHQRGADARSTTATRPATQILGSRRVSAAYNGKLPFEVGRDPGRFVAAMAVTCAAEPGATSIGSKASREARRSGWRRRGSSRDPRPGPGSPKRGPNRAAQRTVIPFGSGGGTGERLTIVAHQDASAEGPIRETAASAAP